MTFKEKIQILNLTLNTKKKTQIAQFSTNNNLVGNLIQS